MSETKMSKKKKTAVICAVVAAVIIAAAAVIGGSYLTEKNRFEKAQSQISVTEKTVELDGEAHELKVEDLISDGTTGTSVAFADGSASITADKVKSEEYKISVDVTANKLWSKFKSFSVTGSAAVVDTTAPEFTESVDEIKITEGDDVDVKSKFKATDLSGDVTIALDGSVDNAKVGTQTLKVTATDVNGNKAEKEVKVTVEEKQTETAATASSASASSSSGKKSSGGSSSGSSSSGSSSSGSSKSTGSSGSSGSSSSGGSSSGSSKSSGSSSSGSSKSQTKNVTPAEVQAEVNAYIRSKGVTVNSSLTPSSASWSGQISRTQEALNKGNTLRHCKEYVDLDISDVQSSNGKPPQCMYCYYDSDSFYILFI